MIVSLYADTHSMSHIGPANVASRNQTQYLSAVFIFPIIQDFLNVPVYVHQT